MENNYSPFSLEHTSEYTRLNVEAQRSFPNQVRPPYISWHFGVWPEKEQNFHDEIDISIRRRKEESWYSDHDRFIRRIVGKKSDELFSRNLNMHGETRDPLLGNVFTFEGLSYNDSILLRVEFHEEYATYTFFVQINENYQDSCGESEAISDGSEEYGGAGSAVQGLPHSMSDCEVDKLVSEVWNAVQISEGEDSNANRERAATDWDRLYDEAWGIAFRDLPNQSEPTSNISIDTSQLRPPGRVFCNFRGIVLPRDWLLCAYPPEELQLQQQRKQQGFEQFVPSDLTGLPSVMKDAELAEEMGFQSGEFGGIDPPTTPRRWNRVSAGRALEMNAALRHALHWVGGIVPSKILKDPHFHRRTVANLVMDGRGLYTSAFACAIDDDFVGNPSETNVSPAKTAVRHAIFYCAENAPNAQKLLNRRLDRLVLRLHSLGTLRLMALKDIDGLNTVDGVLNQVEMDLIPLAINRSLKTQYIMNEIYRLYAILVDLSKYTTGAVLYRVGKSKTYSDDFKRAVSDLYSVRENERIEGWEPYSLFVNRRLYKQFDNIRRIGERLEYVRERLDRRMELAQLTVSVKTARSSESIAKGTWATTIIALVISIVAISDVDLIKGAKTYFYHITDVGNEPTMNVPKKEE